MGECSLTNSLLLALLIVTHVLGEVAHFLINTQAREVARDLHFGEMGCFHNESLSEMNKNQNCSDYEVQDDCESEGCYWDYSGLGIEYQVLSGPAFVAIFSTSTVLLSVLSDKYSTAVPRPVFLGAGTSLLAAGCMLMNSVTSYWEL